MKIPKIGMRTVKSALAVAVCLLSYEYLGYAPPLYACIAAIICMQTDTQTTLKSGVSRISGTVIGGIIGIGFLFLNKLVLEGALISLFIPVGIVVTIYMCLLLKQPHACAISGVALCAVMLIHGNDGMEYYYAIGRIIETAIGVFAAVMINILIPPRVGKENQSPERKDENEQKLSN